MTPGPDAGPPTLPGGSPDPSERYQRVSRIATGGMGEVWRARDTLLGREVAVKILKREYADDPTFRARFEAEARHAAGLHHPGIASVFDYGMLPEDRTPYLVMELVDGKPLSDLLANGQPFDPEVARGLALQVAEALAVAHEAGVVHRDVKPANLLVTPDGRIKITDFGISLATNSVAFTQTGQIVGTPQYLSPEQARGNPATAASDVYALGVVLFECLTGHRPFTGDTPIATALAQIQQEIPPLPDSVPAGLAAVVNRALAKDPSQRYADGAAIATALRECANGGMPTAVMPPTAPAADSTQVLTSAAAPLAGAATLTGASPVDPDAEEPEDEPDKRSRWPLYAAGLLVLALLATLLVTKPWADDNAATDNGTETSAPADPEAETVRVRRADYIGEPVDDAVASLEDLGLETRTRTRENSGTQEADTVADLDPTGNVPVGSRITLEVWGEAPVEEAPEEPAVPDEGDTGQDENDQNDQDEQGDTGQDQGDTGQGEGNGNQGNGNGNGNGNQGNGNGNGNGTTQEPGTQTPSEESVQPGPAAPSNRPGRSNQATPAQPGTAQPGTAEPRTSGPKASKPSQGGTATDE